jgi:Glycosyltransferase family 87
MRRYAVADDHAKSGSNESRSNSDGVSPPAADGKQILEGPAEWSYRIAWLALTAACVGLCVYVIGRAKYSGDDSWLPMTRALDFLHGSSVGLVYDKLFFSDHIKFQYPPSGLLLLDLLRWLGLSTSAEYNLINAFVLIISALAFSIFTTQVVGRARCFGLRIPVGPIAFLIAVRYYPNNLAFQIGQMQILLGLFFLLACLALLHEKRIVAGCLIAAAATVKPQFLPLGLLALWRRDWRFAAGLGVVTAVAAMLSMALYGWDTHLDYLKVLSFLSLHGEYQHLNQSINGILVRFLYDGPSLDRDPSGLIPQSAFPPYIPAVYLATILSSLVMIALPFIIRPNKVDRWSELLGFCTASVLFTMASPIAWVHHYNILLPVYVVALQVIRDRGQGAARWGALVLLGVSFCLTGFALIPSSAPTVPSLNLVQSHVFIGACLLVGVLVAQLVEGPRPSAP